MKRSILKSAAFGLALTLVGGITFAAPPAPPTTEKKPVEDTLFGQKTVDPYRWLEGDNSDPANMGKVTPEVSAWTDKQNEYTRTVLDTLPGRKALEDKLRPLMEIGSVSAPIMRGKYYFYTKREGKENQPRVFVREGASGTPRLLLDLSQVDYTGLTALGGMVPSQDGTYLAVGLYRSGDENTTVYVIETATGQWLADQIEGKAAVGEWYKDNSGFFYEKLADAKNPYSAQIKMHTLGKHPKGDRLLFRQYTPA